MKLPKIIQGSILDFEGDCIVNPANSFLRHGGGLARVIDRAAQGEFYGQPCIAESTHPQIGAVGRWQREQAVTPMVPVGGVHVTSAGLLPYKGVIHAVGPIYGGGHFCEGTLLMSAHIEALAEAVGRDWQRIAFPAISCGIFGYPVDKAARLALRVLTQTTLDVSVYLFSDEHFAAYREAANAYR